MICYATQGGGTVELEANVFERNGTVLKLDDLVTGTRRTV